MAKENRSKKVDEYISGAPKFARPICRKLREIIFKTIPDVKETWKWGPNYQKEGMICGYGAFKSHVHFTFFKGSLMKDSKGIFTEGLNNLHNRGIKFRSENEIDETILRAYLKEALRINKQSLKVTDKTVIIPDDLKKLLRKEKLLKTFEQLAYTHRKEYAEWINSAKKEETRLRRLEKTIIMLKEGRKL